MTLQKTSCKVKINGETSEKIEVQNEVRQRDPLSGVLSGMIIGESAINGIITFVINHQSQHGVR